MSDPTLDSSSLSWTDVARQDAPASETSKLPIIEPFRIKSVEPIRGLTRRERIEYLEQCHGNLFLLPADAVLIDLLTDSGTGAMSSEQWAALMRGDESYAGAKSYQRFERAVRDILGLPHVIPTHQGRAAENLLFKILLQPGDVVPNNTHFDTTRANVETMGAVALDLPCEALADTRSDEPFKGNMDLEALQAVLEDDLQRVPLVMMTLTNNAGGGQPASLENLRGVRALCDQHEVPLYIDACRFAENAWLQLLRDPDVAGRSVADLIRETFDLADGCTMSAKKDGLANIGGFLALRDGELAESARRSMVVTEGFPTYGGLAGRDLDAVAQGLHEVIDDEYLDYRISSIRYVCERLDARGIPVVRPFGGHAIFLDASRFLPHIPAAHYPGQALAIELYVKGGIRSCEIGSVMLAQLDPETGEETPAAQELVRLAIPRRTYTQSHMDYVIEIIDRVWQRRDQIAGVGILSEPPVLRHFGARFHPLPLSNPVSV
ncbi:MAG: tryptophanase [Planctomycetota bacterium]|nr:tryptophanase [Planctomycetota bacterium]MDP6937216.1 tryptophanase [Planctomycetota bacterium]